MKLYQYKQVAWLDENKKIRLSQLPDSIVGQLTFGGVLNLDTNNNELETYLTQNAQDKFGVSTTGQRVYWKNDTTYNIGDMILSAGRLAVGIYFIIGQNEISHETITDLSYNFTCGNITNTISITTGDWVIVNVVNGSVSAQIVKVDNTDAVSSVNGKVGVVNIGIGDIDNLQSTLNSKSSVSVSDTGTATDEISYITINGTEKKIAGGGGSGGGTQLYQHSMDITFVETGPVPPLAIRKLVVISTISNAISLKSELSNQICCSLVENATGQALYTNYTYCALKVINKGQDGAQVILTTFALNQDLSYGIVVKEIDTISNDIVTPL